MSFTGSVFGRLTKDPEVKQSQNGKNYAMISVAVNGGKNQDGTDKSTFVNIKAFGKQGEIISQSFKKGHRIKVDVNQVDASAWINQQSGQAQGSLNALLVGFDFVETKAEVQPQNGGYQPPQQAAAPNYAPPAQGYNNQPPPQQQPPANNYNQPPAAQPNNGYVPPATNPPQQQQNYTNSPWG